MSVGLLFVLLHRQWRDVSFLARLRWHAGSLHPAFLVKTPSLFSFNSCPAGFVALVVIAQSLNAFGGMGPIPTTAQPAQIVSTTAEPIVPGKFQPTGQSLSQYQVPGWYQDRKFGIWAHWSAQCEPEDGD